MALSNLDNVKNNIPNQENINLFYVKCAWKTFALAADKMQIC